MNNNIQKRNRQTPKLCENEKEIIQLVKKYETKLPQPSTSDPLKKHRELFHYLVFQSVKEGIGSINMREIRMPKDGEGADIELSSQDKKKRSIEITECLDGKNSYKDFRHSINRLINGRGNSDVKENHNEREGLTKMFFSDLNKKNSNIEKYKKNGYSTELLIVTDEECNNCPITGTWVEKFLDKKIVERTKNMFDKVYVLVYHASGKDGGPVIREYPKDYYYYQSLIN